MNGERDSALEIGHIIGVHGVRGAVKLRLHDRNSDVLQPGLELDLRGVDDKRRVVVRISRVADKPGSDIRRVWFEDCQTREAGDALRGLEVWVAREHLPALDESEFYLADMLGATVVDQRNQHVELGSIVGVVENFAQDLFEIAWGATTAADKTSPERTWLLPVVPAYIVDACPGARELGEPGRLVVDLPEGLLPAALERALIGETQPRAERLAATQDSSTGAEEPGS